MKKLPILLAATAILLAGFGYLYKSNQENDPMAGIPDTAALEEEFENKQAQKENNTENDNQQQGSFAQDPVYRYTNNLIAQPNYRKDREDVRAKLDEFRNNLRSHEENREEPIIVVIKLYSMDPQSQDKIISLMRSVIEIGNAAKKNL